jgi:PKD domain
VIGFSLFIGTTPVAEVAWRAAGALDWSGPVRLAEGSWASPQVAVDAAGNGLAAFDKGIVQTSYHRAGAIGWDDAITIGGNPFYVASPGFDATGNAAAAWNVWRDPSVVVQTATRTAAGTWQQPPADVSPPGDRIWGPAALAVGSAGDALLAWSYTDGDRSNIHTSFRPRGATAWPAPADVAGNWGVPYGWPFAALDDAGDAIVAWGYQSGGVNVAYRPYGERWEPLQSLSGIGQPAGLAVAAHGSAVVLFTARAPAAVFATSRAEAGSHWLPPVQLSDPGRDAGDASLAGDRRGNAVAVWIERDRAGGRQILRAALHPAASQRWEPAVDVATSDGGAYATRIAMDRSGNAVAVWDPYALTYHRAVDVMELKGGGPILSRLSQPKTGAVGVRARFSVLPLPWGASLVGPTKWEFGDGTSATGNDARHVYTREGRYVVTVSASAADGVSTETGTITIGKPTLANDRRPRIRGLVRVGHTVSCDHGKWSGTEPISYSYGWLRNGDTVGRAEHYRIRKADSGALLACRVKATNGPKTAVAVSRSVRVRP